MYKTEKHTIESNVREPFAKLGNEATLSPFKEFRQIMYSVSYALAHKYMN